MAVIRMTPILPKGANPRTALAGVRAAADETNRLLTQQFERTTRTWSNRPRFVSTVRESSSEVVANTGTENEIYGYINNGTPVRYATMTPDFVSKTVPRVLDSRRGAGGVQFISRAHPRPGIEAREFDRVIAHQQESAIVRILRQQIERAIRELTG